MQLLIITCTINLLIPPSSFINDINHRLQWWHHLQQLRVCDAIGRVGLMGRLPLCQQRRSPPPSSPRYHHHTLPPLPLSPTILICYHYYLLLLPTTTITITNTHFDWFTVQQTGKTHSCKTDRVTAAKQVITVTNYYGVNQTQPLL